MARKLVAFVLVAVPALWVLHGVRAEDSATAQQARASLENYFKAWGEADDAARRKLLEAGWAESGTYTDPSAHVEGREALVKHIGGFKKDAKANGMTIVRSSGIQFHHNSFRFQWEMRGPDGKPGMPGMDYGEFDDQGKITKIVGFFGPFPPMEKSN